MIFLNYVDVDVLTNRLVDIAVSTKRSNGSGGKNPDHRPQFINEKRFIELLLEMKHTPDTNVLLNQIQLNYRQHFFLRSPQAISAGFSDFPIGNLFRLI